MDYPGMNSGMKSEFINEAVKAFWEQEACGTQESIIGNLPELSPAWFRQIEAYRYATEPYIHSIAQFTRHSGSTVLEVGVGAGTDHVQWARAGARCYGVFLSMDCSRPCIELMLRLCRFPIIFLTSYTHGESFITLRVLSASLRKSGASSSQGAHFLA
jgi:hypothetical protein